jgi:hypothetical protein
MIFSLFSQDGLGDHFYSIKLAAHRKPLCLRCEIKESTINISIDNLAVMAMRVDNEESRQRLRSKNEWLEKRINEACPLPDGPYWFEYNEFHDFWRAGYHGRARKMIRHYEALKDIDLGSQYVLLIDENWIYIRKPSTDVQNQYDGWLANTPMDAPLEQREIWSLRDKHPDLRLASGHITSRLKSHVHTLHEKALTLKFEALYRDELVPLGYSLQVLFKGRGRSIDYSIVLTHNTETPDACVQCMISDGFAPYQSPKNNPVAKAKPQVDQAALAAREQELLKELDEVRKKMAS